LKHWVYSWRSSKLNYFAYFAFNLILHKMAYLWLNWWILQWLTDRKKRKLVQEDVGNLPFLYFVKSIPKDLPIFKKVHPFLISDVRRRIELIQDFDMPDCSNCISMSKNCQYIFTCGTYKPRVKCYDVENLSMKFERCMDAEPLKALVLSDGYEKVILYINGIK